MSIPLRLPLKLSPFLHTPTTTTTVQSENAAITPERSPRHGCLTKTSRTGRQPPQYIIWSNGGDVLLHGRRGSLTRVPLTHAQSNNETREQRLFIFNIFFAYK